MTRQIKDILIINNKEYPINDNLLNYFFELNPHLFIKRKYIVTCLWRGYIATFELKNKSLFLNKIELLMGSDYQFEEINIYEKDKIFKFFTGFIQTESKYLYFEEGILKKEFYNNDDLSKFVNELIEKYSNSKAYLKIKNELQKIEISDKEIDQILILSTNHLKYCS